ncbi:hypothetical protein [Mesorhizobium kowhaii]|uniref:hypothetical protein n=1 Tax=Mesorhizobium kowhaii TaxID=1300272 RepID=UPI001FDEE0A4|nr:hypothetical protein [Mesorhizobium kowhaii]
MTMFWLSSALSAEGWAIRIWRRLWLWASIEGADSSKVSSGAGLPHNAAQPASVEGRPHSVTVGRMDVRGQVFKLDVCVAWYAPKVIGPVIHRQRIAIHVPRKKGYPRGFDGTDQVLGFP